MKDTARRRFFGGIILFFVALQFPVGWVRLEGCYTGPICNGDPTLAYVNPLYWMVEGGSPFPWTHLYGDFAWQPWLRLGSLVYLVGTIGMLALATRLLMGRPLHDRAMRWCIPVFAAILAGGAIFAYIMLNHGPTVMQSIIGESSSTPVHGRWTSGWISLMQMLLWPFMVWQRDRALPAPTAMPELPT